MLAQTMEKTFDPESLAGLSNEEAAKRLREDGYNELLSQKKQSLLSIFLNVPREPMLILLLGFRGGFHLSVSGGSK